jgi:putative ABC transport system permease protein
MSLAEVFVSALRAIKANLTRAALTLLGVLIGVGSVILLLGVGSGASASVADRIASMGSNAITVAAGFGGSGTRYQTLTMSTVQALEDQAAVPDVDTVVPVASTSATAVVGSLSTTAQVVGTTADYFEVTNSPVAQGTAFSAVDNQAARDVCVLGADLAAYLFPDTDPVGQTVSIGGRSLVVYGVMASKDSLGNTGGNSAVVAPISRVQRSMTGYGELNQIVLAATSDAAVDAAAAEAQAAIAAQLGVAQADLSVTVTTQAQLLATTQQIGDTLGAMLAAIAAISLVVGGIGVMNIMLVTVSERTREIGIRKALGAPRGAIALQFITEATILSLLGGAGGVATAWIASHFTIMGTKPVIGSGPVLLAFGVAVAIGVVFGGYPAIRASGLRPVEALRHE